MDIENIYALSIGALFVILVAWQVAIDTSSLISRALTLANKYLVQTLVVTRVNGTGDFSVGAAAVNLIVIGGNLVACLFRVSNKKQFGARLGKIAVLNLVPLFMGGGASFVANFMCGLPLQDHGTAHRWVGRLAAVEAFAHLFVQLSSMTWALTLPHILLLSTLTIIIITSVLYVRRHFFELFLKLHIVLNSLLISLLWFHFTIGLNIATISLALASAAWLFQSVWRLFRIAYKNTGGRDIDKCSITKLSGNEAVLLEVDVRRPWRVQHGQYIYITVPSLPHSLSARFQAHPYLVVWTTEDAKQKCQTLTLLIQSRRGFSRGLLLCRDEATVLLDGPYGKSPRLDLYDTLLFACSGVGISAHLLAIRQLLDAHDQKTARVRRISLSWFLEKPDHEAWVKPMLKQLMDLDHRRILSMLIITTQEHGAQTQPVADQEYVRWFRASLPTSQIGYIINQERTAEAGNMAVSLCGSPTFESTVRAALRKSQHHISLITTPFQMDDVHQG